MSSPGNPGGSGGENGAHPPGLITVDVSDTDLSADDFKALLLDDEEEDPVAIWHDFQIKNFYEYDHHKYMAGITTPDEFQGDTAAFFQLAAPTLFWITRWTACRSSAAPDIPSSFLLADDDWVLLDEHYEPHNIALHKNGIIPIYRISGTYSYGHRNPIKGGDDILNHMNFGRPPWISESIERNVRTSVDEVTSIIDSQSKSVNVSPGNPGGPIKSSRPPG